MTRDARLSRRSTVAVLGSGAALASPAFAPDRLQRAPRTQVVVPGGRGPEPPGANGYEPPPQDATPRSAFRIVLEHALNERGCVWSSIGTLRSQERSCDVVKKIPSVRPRESGDPGPRTAAPGFPSISAFTRIFDALCAGMSGGEVANPTPARALL